MRSAALTLVFVALAMSAFVLWRAMQAVTHRDEQPADSNDVCFAVAVVGFYLALAFAGLLLGWLSG